MNRVLRVIWLMFSIFSYSPCYPCSPCSPSLLHCPCSPIRDGMIPQFILYFLLFFLCHFIFLYFPQLLVVIVAQTLSSPISYCRLPAIPTHHFHKIKGQNINVKKRQKILKIKDNSDGSQDALRGFPNI